MAERKRDEDVSASSPSNAEHIRTVSDNPEATESIKPTALVNRVRQL